MSYRLLLALLLRVTGVIVLAWALAGMSATFASFYRQGTGVFDYPLLNAALIAVLTAIIPVAIGCVLIAMPGRFVRELPADPVPAGPADAGQAAHLHGIAFSVLGVYFVASAIQSLASCWGKLDLYARYVADSANGHLLPAMLPDDFAALVAAVVQLVIGVALFAAGRPLAELWARWRSPRPVAADAAPQDPAY